MGVTEIHGDRVFQDDSEADPETWFFMEPKIRYCVHNSLPLVHVISHMNAVHTQTFIYLRFI
jgi:hypothetical protein